jgi:hypothetical protein
VKSRARLIIETYALIFVARTAFPRLVDRLFFPARFSKRRLAGRLAFNTLFVFAAHKFLLPAFKSMAEHQQAVRGELRTQLGRDPTQEELVERLLADRR